MHNDKLLHFIHKKKTTNNKNNYIIRIKTMNKIQHIKIHKNYVVLLFMFN